MAPAEIGAASPILEMAQKEYAAAASEVFSAEVVVDTDV